MRVVYLTHSLRSCWNHGNAHFLRGVLRELVARGHEARIVEPEGAWSAANLVADHGTAALEGWQEAYPELAAAPYDPGEDAGALAERLTDGADAVIVHEWNEPALVAAVGRVRARGGRFRLLFHDTHHRAVSEPEAMRRYDLSGYDGVLAFGDALSAVYRSWGWGGRVHTWHEAADVRLFRPPDVEGERAGAVWIGNWGDGERTAELERFLFEPMAACGVPLDVFGVRYPGEALEMLARYGARYHGWLANHRAPGVFARHLVTVHVPRRFYTTVLPGIPTIRMFEALACGIPLVSAPWEDREGLFAPGRDFLVARSGEEMAAQLRRVVAEPELRAELGAAGLATVRARHTCGHRVDELLAILGNMGMADGADTGLAGVG